MTVPGADADRNVLLVLHFGECDERAAAGTRAHVAGCASCREYLATVSAIEQALLAWPDEPAPAGILEGLLARVSRPPARAPAASPPPSALPLLCLLPVMAALVAGIRMLAGRLAALPLWPQLAGSPAADAAIAVGAAAGVALGVGALATLALAPALVLETASLAGLRPRPAASRA